MSFDVAELFIGDREVAPRLDGLCPLGKGFADGQELCIECLRPVEVAEFHFDVAEPVIGDREVSVCTFCSKTGVHFLTGGVHFRIGFFGLLDTTERVQRVAEIPDGTDIGLRIVLGKRGLIAMLTVGDELALPCDGGLVAARDALAVLVHGDELLHGLGEVGVRGALDEREGAGVVGLDVDAVQIGEADKEIVLGVVVVFTDGDPFHPIKERVGKGRPVAYVDGVGDRLVECAQEIGVRRNQHGGEDGFLGFSRLGILDSHDVVFFVYEIGRDGEGEETAFLHRLGNTVVEVLARGQKLVVPNGDIAAEVVFVDEVHELLCVLSVLLPIAQKNIGVKGLADLLRQLVADEDGREILRELLVVGERGRVLGVRVQALQISANGIKICLQSAFLQDGEHGDVMRDRIAKFHVERPIPRMEQTVGYGHQKQIHASEVEEKRLLVVGGRRLPVVVDGAVLLLQDRLCHRRKKGLVIVGVSTEPNAGLALRRAFAAGLILYVSHTVSPSLF